VINHRFDDALDQQEKKWKISSPHVYLGVSPHQISAFNSELRLASDLVVATKLLAPSKTPKPRSRTRTAAAGIITNMQRTWFGLSGPRKTQSKNNFLFPGKRRNNEIPRKKGKGMQISNQSIS